MLILIPKRYDTPKWQAPVVPRKNAFFFADGTPVVNLYELKQALTTLPDEVIYTHVHEGQNDIASWVEGCIGDQKLAEALKSQTHRWGMIVALERQLMRTLNLPGYLARRWLANVDAPFIFVTGESVASLPGLADILEKVSDETVAFHYQRYPNDISAWIAASVGDHEIADLLLETTSRPQMITYLRDHLAMLQDAADND